MGHSGNLVKKVLQRIDPRLRRQFIASLDRPQALPPCPGRLVLVGHRGAGKSSLLPVFAAQLGVPGLDLDATLEREHGGPLASWVLEDQAGFRAAERRAFQSLPAHVVISVGGGFLFHHSEVLANDTPVLVPVTFETYCERLRADTTRPRLFPHLPLADELRLVYQEREAFHRKARTVPLAGVVRTLLATQEAASCSAS